MYDEILLYNKYTAMGYKNLGCINTNKNAYSMVQKSTNKEELKIGRCEYFIVCHDLKAFATVDSGD